MPKRYLSLPVKYLMAAVAIVFVVVAGCHVHLTNTITTPQTAETSEGPVPPAQDFQRESKLPRDIEPPVNSTINVYRGPMVDPPPPPPDHTAPKQPQSPLKVVGSTILVLDPACNACNGATLWLGLRNEGSKTALLALAAGPATGEAKGTVANARTSLVVKTDGQPVVKDRFPPNSLAPGRVLEFGVQLEGTLAAGKWNVTLDNDSTRLSTLQFVVPEIPLNVKFGPGESSLRLTRGEATNFVLENSDAAGYRFTWEFRAGSRIFGHAEQANLAVSERKTNSQGAVQNPANEPPDKIAGKGSVRLAIKPDRDWFGETGDSRCWSCRFRDIFRNDVRRGYLVLHLHSDSCPDDAGGPSKVIPLRVELSYFGRTEKSVYSYLILVFLLVLGAVTSLYINYKFPDEAIRSGLRKNLQDLAISIESLSMKLASRLRVLVGVERRVLAEWLSSLAWYSADFEVTRSAIAAATARLSGRVKQLEEMSRLREEYERLITKEVPPTIMDKMETLFEQIGALVDDLKPTDTDIQIADRKLAEIKDLLDGWAKPFGALTAEIVEDLNNLIRALDDHGELAESRTYRALKERFPGLDAVLRGPERDTSLNVSEVTSQNYYEWDCRAFRGNQIRAYAAICDRRVVSGESAGSLRGASETPPYIARRGELIRLLLEDSWDSMRRARRLVSEMSQEIYSADIEKEIVDQRIEIRLDRNRVRAFEPAQFEIHFLNPKFDNAGARDEFCCTWNFGHPAFPDMPWWKRFGKWIWDKITFSRKPVDSTTDYLEETGWSVAHYYPKEGTYNVWVRFRHESDGPLYSASRRSVVDRVNPVFSKDDYVVAAKLLTVGKRSGVFAGEDRRHPFWSGLVDKFNAIARVALGLVPAILGLVAGAREQLLKMALPVALGAIFTAGFGSDQVKNLLSQKPKT